MNRDEMIQKAARALRVAVYPSIGNVSWEDLRLSDQEHYLQAARATLEAVNALPPGPMTVGMRKRSPEGDEAILSDENDAASWFVYKMAGSLFRWIGDKDVATWEVIPDAPKNHAAVMLAGIPDESLAALALDGTAAGCGITLYVAGLAAQAELDRRKGLAS